MPRLLPCLYRDFATCHRLGRLRSAGDGRESIVDARLRQPTTYVATVAASPPLSCVSASCMQPIPLSPSPLPPHNPLHTPSSPPPPGPITAVSSVNGTKEDLVNHAAATASIVEAEEDPNVSELKRQLATQVAVAAELRRLLMAAVGSDVAAVWVSAPLISIPALLVSSFDRLSQSPVTGMSHSPGHFIGRLEVGSLPSCTCYDAAPSEPPCPNAAAPVAHRLSRHRPSFYGARTRGHAPERYAGTATS